MLGALVVHPCVIFALRPIPQPNAFSAWCHLDRYADSVSALFIARKWSDEVTAAVAAVDEVEEGWHVDGIKQGPQVVAHNLK